MQGKLRFILGLVIITVMTFAVREVLKKIFLPPPSAPLAAKAADPASSPFRIAAAAVGNKLDGNYVFTDQNGGRFDLATWFDKPMVVSFVFTNCPVVCPAITSSLSKIAKSNKDRLGKDFRIVTISFDTSKDTPDVMLKFGHNFTDDFTNWKFVTGSATDVKAVADRLGIVYKPDNAGGFLHTVGVTVIGPGGKVAAQVFGPQYSNEDILRPVESALEKNK